MIHASGARDSEKQISTTWCYISDIKGMHYRFCRVYESDKMDTKWIKMGEGSTGQRPLASKNFQFRPIGRFLNVLLLASSRSIIAEGRERKSCSTFYNEHFPAIYYWEGGL